jgi:hypothetical protein
VNSATILALMAAVGLFMTVGCAAEPPLRVELSPHCYVEEGRYLFCNGQKTDAIPPEEFVTR